jgi:hypothetical protein
MYEKIGHIYTHIYTYISTMGVYVSKHRKIFSYCPDTTANLEKKIISCIDNNDSVSLFNYLDVLQTHGLNIDKYYCGLYTLPYYVITSNLSSEDKYKMLSDLLKRYKFDLNKKINRYGNIIVCSVDHEKYIPIYELLLYYGAEINCVDYILHGTSLDILNGSKSTDDVNLRNFLISQGAKSLLDGIAIVK